MFNRGVVDREEAARPRVDDPHRHRIGLEQQPIGFLALLERGEVGQRGADEIAHPRQADADVARRAAAGRERQLEALALAVGLDQPAQPARQRLGCEAEPLFSQPAPAQAIGRHADQLGGGGVEFDDLKVRRSPRIVVDDGEGHHSVVAGVEGGVDQAVAGAALGEVDRDEVGAPAVRDRQGEDVVGLGLAGAREIGLIAVRQAVGDRPFRRLAERESAIGRELSEARLALGADQPLRRDASEATDLPAVLSARQQDDAVVDRAEPVEQQVFVSRRVGSADPRDVPSAPQLRRLLRWGRRTASERDDLVKRRAGHRSFSVRELATAINASPAKKSLKCR